MNKIDKKVLIIGMSKTGKTHFGGQLYGRLKNKQNEFETDDTPADLSLFDNVLDCMNDGIPGEHTSSKQNETIILPTKSKKGNVVNIVYPDYGGEQIRDIVELRQVPKIWKEQIRESDHWFLFIRLGLIEKITDITTKFYEDISSKKEESPDTQPQPLIKLPQNSAAFYIELLQIFLYIKEITLTSPNKPQLTILLSCWDKLKIERGISPAKVLTEKMPLFSSFVKNIWPQESLVIIGVSSLGQDLDAKKPDKGFQAKGPEEFGYWILPDGESEKDLTKILNYVVR